MGICLPDSCSHDDIKEGLLGVESRLETENVTWKFLIINCEDQYDSVDFDAEDIIML